MSPARRRLRLDVRGAVQGVGFRPFVYRLAADVGVGGWILNDAEGVRIEVEADEGRVEAFAARLGAELPPRAAIHELRRAWVAPEQVEGFEIRRSDGTGRRTAVVLPDLATCDDCRRELLDPADRRHGYPFTNCTNCGPRYTIVRRLPYDRPNTTMAGFTMCPACRAEYENPLDRRFHAQPNACPSCGPRVALWDAAGVPLSLGGSEAVIAAAAETLGHGGIVAVKGIGGFHLVCDARDDAAVRRLRERKRRWGKPLAVMVADLEAARALCEVSGDEAALLASVESPIVLLARHPYAAVAPSVAPGTRRLGLMLAYAPLHHLLLRAAPIPLVATSGNRSEEPICIDESSAVARLGGIADAFLVHDRPIERHVDDSVAWVLRGPDGAPAPALLRRARGYAPLPLRFPREVPPLLAVGAHQKSTVALAVGRQAVVSQHIGDLDAPEAIDAFRTVTADLIRLWEACPVAVAHDLHPAYASTLWAQDPDVLRGVPRVGVQHHHAHLASCLTDNGVAGTALGVVWDGSGWGAGADGVGDGTVWGGECLVGDARAARRAAHLLPFRLPGGEAAVREPRRSAVALLWELFGPEALELDELAPVRDFSPTARGVLAKMLDSGLRTPVTTSAGRLFDAVAALVGVAQRSAFEGEAAMLLEQLADPRETGAYALPLTMPVPTPANPRPPLVLDWRPLVRAVLLDLWRHVDPALISARFHNGLVAAIVAVARQVGEERVALTGGCFQNRLLVERAAAALGTAGFRVLVHRNVPPNDGGISLGQLAVAAARLGA